MDDDIVYSALSSKSDEELEKGFVTAIIEQPKLLDELAKQLVTLGLAIPGLYATVLKFIGGDDAVAKSSGLIIWSDDTGLPIECYSEDRVKGKAEEISRHFMKQQ
jgi:hypothetical protein